MISPEDLKYFVEVSLTGHFTRASERLGVSQPTLSHAVKKIERELKTELFVRSKKGVTLTQSGEILLKSSKKLIDDWQSVRDAIFLNQDEPRGLIRLGCHQSVAQYTLPHFLPDLLKKHQDLNFQITHGLSREVTNLVIINQTDVGVVVNPVKHQDLIITPLCKDDVCLWRAKNCKNNDVLIVEPSLLQTLDIMNQLKKKNQNYKRIIESSSLEVIAKLVMSGTGVGILPTRILDAYKSHGCEVMLNSPHFKDEICLIYKQDFRRTVRGQELIKAIKSIY